MFALPALSCYGLAPMASRSASAARWLASAAPLERELALLPFALTDALHPGETREDRFTSSRIGLRLRGSVRRWSTRGGGHAWLCGRRFVRRGRIAVRHLSCPGGRGLPPEQHRRLGSPPQRWPLPPHRSARGCRRAGACACQALHRPGCGAGAGRGAEKAARGGVGAAAAAMGAALGRGRAQPGDGGRGRAALCGSRRA